MSRNSSVTRSGDLDSLPSWISNHLGERSSFMTNEVNQSPASPMEGSPPLETNPLAAIHPSVEEKTNIMTLEEIDALRETYSFPSRVRVRLPEEGETITSARPSEVAFYEAAFPAGLRFPMHPTIRNLFSLNSNPKPDQGWLYFKARNKKTLLGGYPSNVKEWKSKFFFVLSNEWEVPEGSSREGAPRVPRTLGVPGTAGESHPNSEVLSSSSDMAMSKRISFKKLGKKLEKSKNRSSSGIFAPAKGVVIGEKRTGESLASSANKKGKVDDSSKGKGVDREPKGKKKAISLSNAPTTLAMASSRPEEVEKLTLDQKATKLFHVIGQALVLNSSLAVRSREAGEQASLQEGQTASMETEQANDELTKTKSDRDSLADKVERSGVLVVELREALSKANKSTVEDSNPCRNLWWQSKILLLSILARGSTSARCSFVDITPTSPSILKAPWSTKIFWRSKTRLPRKKKKKRWARTRG
ncbi:hypothetical protein Acr_00g0014680 [Actinidia rufa]|uniref:Uncharacterized protein n=1 Tax=Actinidia rufa TaxID=165716 RepID=A0A7J0DAI4_9ERIC|nr:hypothetical protein Acr_00g0014680 [Actinidia rufa]